MKYESEFGIVEAIQFIDDSYGNLCALGGLGLKPVVLYNPLRIEVKTSDGVMYANEGDYIVKDITGKIYPCKLDQFKKDYKPMR